MKVVINIFLVYLAAFAAAINSNKTQQTLEHPKVIDGDCRSFFNACDDLCPAGYQARCVYSQSGVKFVAKRCNCICDIDVGKPTGKVHTVKNKKVSNFNIKIFRKKMLQEHNRLRAKHESTPLMTLEETLNDFAQSVAENNARKGYLEHSNIPGLNYGENIFTWRKFSGKPSGLNSVQSWYDEVKDYNYDTGRAIDEKTVIGHFTQVVWKTSLKLGIGRAYSTDEKSVYVVGIYDPPGNYVGENKQKVGKII